MKKIIMICFGAAMAVLLSSCNASDITEQLDLGALLENEAVQNAIAQVAEETLASVQEEATVAQEDAQEDAQAEAQAEEEEDKNTGYSAWYKYEEHTTGPNGEAFDIYHYILLQYSNADGSDGVSVRVVLDNYNGEIWGGYSDPSEFGSSCSLTIYDGNLYPSSWGKINWLSVSGDTVTANITMYAEGNGGDSTFEYTYIRQDY